MPCISCMAGQRQTLPIAQSEPHADPVLHCCDLEVETFVISLKWNVASQIG